jgi:hypothetical protein
MKNILMLIIAIAFAGCAKKKSAVELWQDNKGNEVPVTVTQKQDTTVYDFGVMVMSEEPVLEERRDFLGIEVQNAKNSLKFF